jgi:hypothetical protein
MHPIPTKRLRRGRRQVHHHLLALGAAAAMGGAGVGATEMPQPSPTAEPAQFATLQSEIFDQRCTSATCHAAGNRAGNLSLMAAQSYDELVNVEAANPAAAAAGLQRVAPEDPEGSFLMRKLTGDLGPGEGSSMPLGGSPLGEEDLALIRTWIQDGALRGE